MNTRAADFATAHGAAHAGGRACLPATFLPSGYGFFCASLWAASRRPHNVTRTGPGCSRPAWISARLFLPVGTRMGGGVAQPPRRRPCNRSGLGA